MACTDFIASQIPIIEAQITAYQNAITAFGNDDIQSYKLDTGQTVQTVTRSDVLNMQKTIDSLFNRLSMITARCGGAMTLVRPAW